jgi:hypothetical protein
MRSKMKLVCQYDSQGQLKTIYQISTFSLAHAYQLIEKLLACFVTLYSSVCCLLCRVNFTIKRLTE